MTWKQFWCDHHWHTDKGSYRKVKNKGKPVCQFESEKNKKYFTKDIIGWCIFYKYFESCCHCNKKNIEQNSIFADSPATVKTVMTYPDIDNQQLEI